MPLGLPAEVINEILDEMHAKFVAGKTDELLGAIRFCGNEQLIMPEWVVDAFFKATNKWYSYNVKTLDEAFGVVWPKGKHLNAAKKRRTIAPAVYQKVIEASKNGRAIDLQLFEEVSRDLKINKTDAIKYYSQVKKWREQMIEPYLQEDK